MAYSLAIGMPGFGEWVLIALLGLLFFGRRLPEVGRSVAKSIVEFKKGLKEIETDVEDATVDRGNTTVASPQHRFDPYTGKPLPAPDQRFDPYTGKPVVDTQQKFDPYTGKPLAESESISQSSPAAH